MNCRDLLFVLVVALVGCGSKYAGDGAVSTEMPTSQAEAANEQSTDPTATDTTATDTADPRKIIYTATIDLVVEDFNETEQQVTRLVSQMGGYISQFREDRRYGGQLAGQWQVRVPVSQFQIFVRQVLDLGVPMMRQIDAQDVTEQYIDLTARLDNKRRLEERILKLLDAQTGNIKDVIEVESQLGRVREDIEVMEGKLRFLSDRIAMTTVTITAREERDYIPDQAPTFAAKIKNVFGESLSAMRRFGEGLVLVAVAVAPWLALVGLALIPPIVWYRRRRRR